nr:MAG TPA: hypothetical protein [Caudoviricetes sp.]
MGAVFEVKKIQAVSRGCSGHRPVAPTHPIPSLHSRSPHRRRSTPDPPGRRWTDFIYTSYNISTTKHLETPLHITKR